MTNREHNREVLKNCTHLAKWRGVERYMPVWVKNGKSHNPQGLAVMTPSELKPATLDEILDYLDEDGTIAVNPGFGATL